MSFLCQRSIINKPKIKVLEVTFGGDSFPEVFKGTETKLVKKLNNLQKNYYMYRLLNYGKIIIKFTLFNIVVRINGNYYLSFFF